MNSSTTLNTSAMTATPAEAKVASAHASAAAGSGAANKVVSQLLRLAPRNIIYVACDPVALARDLQVLTASGYQVKGMRAFDIFPHTHHFETVVALSR